VQENVVNQQHAGLDKCHTVGYYRLSDSTATDLNYYR